MRNFVLKGHICYSETPERVSVNKSSYLVCENSVCAGVFSKLPEKYGSLPIFDFGNRLILPGLVDLHIHAPQYAYRGLGMDMELLDWLNQKAFPEEAKYADLSYAEAAYSIFASQMKKSATTRACVFATMHTPATELLMDLMEESGLVSFVGKVNMDRNAPDILCEKSAAESVESTRQWLSDIDGKYRRTMPILTPRFIPSCSDGLLKSLKEIQTQYSLAVQSHLSENKSEIEWVHSLCPDAKYYGDAYDRYGLFGRDTKTVMAHCVYSSKEELGRMKDNGVFVAHCPASNMNLSSGIAPIRNYLDVGMRVGLGSDVAGGQTESIFRAIVDAIQVSKLYFRLVDDSCAPLKFEEALYMATKGGGEFFGKVGSFENGYEFDAVIVDDSDLPYPQKLSVRQRLERIVYLSSDIQNIYAKFVAGKRIF